MPAGTEPTVNMERAQWKSGKSENHLCDSQPSVATGFLVFLLTQRDDHKLEGEAERIDGEDLSWVYQQLLTTEPSLQPF